MSATGQNKSSSRSQQDLDREDNLNSVMATLVSMTDVDGATVDSSGGSVCVSSGSSCGGAGHVPDNDNPLAPPKQKNLEHQATGRLANLLDRTR